MSLLPKREKPLSLHFLVGEGFRTGKAYGPLMGRIWDPSPETYNHVHPVVFWLGIDVPSWERLKLPVPDVAGTDNADLKVRRNDNSVPNGRKIERAIFD